jgi:glc operon protein GlcG
MLSQKPQGKAMSVAAKHLRLTHHGAIRLLQAAIAKAEAMGVPQCIAVVDDGGHLLAFARMDGAKFLSIDSSTRKAVTAANSRAPTGNVADGLDIKLAHATSGKLTNLKGGLPIVIDGIVVGGIGVGSGTGEQDLEVAQAAVAALGKMT